MAYAFLGTTSSGAGSGATSTIVRSFATGNGGFLCIKQVGTTQYTISSVKDQSGNAIPYSIAGGGFTTVSSNASCALLWVPNFNAATSVVVTMTGTPSTALVSYVAEYSGLTSTLAITSGNGEISTQTASSGTLTLTSITPTLAVGTGILFACAFNITTSTPPTHGAGYTPLPSNWGSGGLGDYFRLTSASSTSVTFGCISGDVYQAMAVAIDEVAVYTGVATGSSVVSGQSANQGSATSSGSAIGLGASQGTSTGTSIVAGLSANKGLSSGAAAVTGLSASQGSAPGSGLATGSSASQGIASGTSTVTGEAASIGSANGSTVVTGLVFAGGYTGVAAGTSNVVGLYASAGAAASASQVAGVGAHQGAAVGYGGAIGIPLIAYVGLANGESFVIGVNGTIAPPPFTQANPLRTIASYFKVRTVTASAYQQLAPATLPSKTPLEQVTVNFDYTKLLPSGVMVTSATISCAVYAGVDPNSSMVGTTPAISQSGLVASSFISGGVSGVGYVIECLAECSDGEVLALLARMGCQGYVTEISPTPPTPPDSFFLITQSGLNLVTQSGLNLVTQQGDESLDFLITQNGSYLTTQGGSLLIAQ